MAGARTSGHVEPKPELPMNTSNDEFGAVFSADGSTMYFTTEAGGRQRLMTCRMIDGVWGTPQEVSLLPSSRIRNIGMPALSSDGQYMVFAAMLTESTGYGRTDLYSARRVNGFWGDIRNLGASVNSSGWDSHPSMSSDGTLLFFASDRDGGEGGTDIYMCVRTGSTWSKAVPLRGVNTPADESAPFISPDRRILYFVSERVGGMGGSDLYRSVLDADSVSSVRMMDPPVNTVSNEYGLCMTACGDRVVVSSDRTGGAGRIDLVPMPRGIAADPQMTVLTGLVSRTDTSERTVSWISVHSLDDGRGEVDVRVDDETGRYSAVVAPGHDYAITSWETDAVVQTRRVRIAPAEKGTVRFLGLTQMPCDEESSIAFPVSTAATDGSMSMLTQIELRRMSDILLAHPEFRVVVEVPVVSFEAEDSDSAGVTGRMKAIRSYLNLRGVPLSAVLVRGATRSIEGAEDELMDGIRTDVIMSLTKKSAGGRE
ncbi:MAG: TolB family protein [Candidatus Kapaibacterium sp.]